MKRTSLARLSLARLFSAFLLGALRFLSARAEIPGGTLQPNHLSIPYPGGIAVFKNTAAPVDPVNPVRG